MFAFVDVHGMMNLQSTLAANSGGSDHPIFPHHPISCYGEFGLYEDGRFECEHAEAPPGDGRTKSAINHSISLLIFEEAHRMFEHANGDSCLNKNCQWNEQAQGR